MDGKITISHSSSNRGPDEIRIEVEDDSSGIRFLLVTMSLEEFAKAITGLGYVDCKFNLVGLELVGKVRETKTEVVDIPESFSSLFDKKEVSDEILKPFEIDGWKGHKDDLNNHHNMIKGGKAYRVLFVRYIDKK